MSRQCTAPPPRGPEEQEEEEADDDGPPRREAHAQPRAVAGPAPGRPPAVVGPRRFRYQPLAGGAPELPHAAAGPSGPPPLEPPSGRPPADGEVARNGAEPPPQPTVVGRGCAAAAVRLELEAMRPPSKEAVPERPQKSLATRAHEYVAFLVFGMGCGWVVVAGSYMELPVYQERFGLKASNRMTIGYNIGAASFPIFVCLQYVMQRRGLSFDYRALIVALAAVNALALLGAAFLVDSLEALVLLQVVGGGYGWLTGLVHQRYILLSRDSAYVAVFWAGDAASAVLAAALALAQRPERGQAERSFGPEAFYLGPGGPHAACCRSGASRRWASGCCRPAAARAPPRWRPRGRAPAELGQNPRGRWRGWCCPPGPSRGGGPRRSSQGWCFGPTSRSGVSVTRCSPTPAPEGPPGTVARPASSARRSARCSPRLRGRTSRRPCRDRLCHGCSCSRPSSRASWASSSWPRTSAGPGRAPSRARGTRVLGTTWCSSCSPCGRWGCCCRTWPCAWCRPSTRSCTGSR
ncbi:unnamed protein product [Prorocentrum cordatum]|uniref:Uncharacterized protein n=1 Tax=Prorocentrum cordatum TaxID=2364126 RepID=A0ABN9PRZ8_9DINO|nr:unnamed protein product [Polarella glacialis]